MGTYNYNDTTLYNLRMLYEQLGYKRYKMSKFEEYDLYLEYKKFLTTENIITFTDLNGKLYALKPDITLSIAKNAKPGETQKLYYKENVYRASAETKEYKEITQLGLEYIGDIDAYTLGEVVLLAARSLHSISDNYVLDISHMGFVSALLDETGLSDSRKEKLLTYLGKKDAHELRFNCEKYGVDADVTESIVALCEIYGDFESTYPKIKDLAVSHTMLEAVQELESVYTFLKASGEGAHINLDFSIVNDMSYYNGVIFRGYIESVPCSVLSGGRYDNLLLRLGKNCQAMGFAVYVDMLELYAKHEKEYDVDVMLCYDSSVTPVQIAEKAAEYTSQGKSVKVMSYVPEGLKYKQLVKFSKEGESVSDGIS